MASILERLFPVEQLEALGNKWPENAPKRRKLDTGASQAQQTWPMPAPVRRQHSGSAIPDMRHHRLSTSSQQQQRGINPRYTTKSTQIRRSNSESMPRNSPTPSASSVRSNSTSVVQKSCLPAFIEPSLMQVYLHNLHPRDRSRYSLPGSPTWSSGDTTTTTTTTTTTRPEESRRTTMASRREHSNEDSMSSPGSLTTDTSSPQYSGEACTTPPASAGPFSDLIYGLRLTEHERGFMNDLLNPSLGDSDMFATMAGEKRRLPDLDEGAVDPANFFGPGGDDSFQTVFPPPQHEAEAAGYSGYEYAVTTNDERENDVHSSGLSPTAEEEDEGGEEEESTPAGIVMPVHAALSVDDFFDLDEAADDLSPLAI